MSVPFDGLQGLLESDRDARSYYDSLPEYVREHIETRAHNVNSYSSLRDFAENLLRGDI